MSTRLPINNGLLQNDLDCDGFNIINVGSKDGKALPRAFTDLSDTPAAYKGFSGRYVTVSGDEKTLEFSAPANTSIVAADVSVTVDTPNVVVTIPQAFLHLRILAFARRSSAGFAYLIAQVGPDADPANYLNTVLTVSKTAATPSGQTMPGLVIGAVNGTEANLPDYAISDARLLFYSGGGWKRVQAKASYYVSPSTTGPVWADISAVRRGSDAITQLTLFAASGNIAAGSRIMVICSNT